MKNSFSAQPIWLMKKETYPGLRFRFRVILFCELRVQHQVT